MKSIGGRQFMKATAGAAAALATSGLACTRQESPSSAPAPSHRHDNGIAATGGDAGEPAAVQ